MKTKEVMVVPEKSGRQQKPEGKSRSQKKTVSTRKQILARVEAGKTRHRGRKTEVGMQAKGDRESKRGEMIRRGREE